MTDTIDDKHEGGAPEGFDEETAPVQPPTDQPAKASFSKLSSVLDEAFKRMDARANGDEKPLKTPWPSFNQQLPGGGFWPGCHVLVSGTGAGKSTWALQLALQSARGEKDEHGKVVTHPVSVAYVGLELEDAQLALRLAAYESHVHWSDLYTGEAKEEDRTKARGAREALAELPFYLVHGESMAWAASSLEDTAKRLREDTANRLGKGHEGHPILIVLDFLQLVGPEPDSGRQDLRERIGRAAYHAREVARKYHACVLLVSSVAREHYKRVNGLDALKEAGLSGKGFAEGGGQNPTPGRADRYMTTPDNIVGVGKESGEIEYAADSVTVAVAMERDGSGERQVVFATPKLRAGQPSWCVLAFDGRSFKNYGVTRQGDAVYDNNGADIVAALQGEAKSDGADTKSAQRAGNGAPSKSRRPADT